MQTQCFCKCYFALSWLGISRRMRGSICMFVFVLANASPQTRFGAHACIPSLRRWERSPRATRPHQQTTSATLRCGRRPLQRCKVKIDSMVPTLHFSLNGETEVVDFNHGLLRDVLDAVDASNAYVHFSDCLVGAVLCQRGRALVQFGQGTNK